MNNLLVLWEIITREKIAKKDERYQRAMEKPKVLVELMKICTLEHPNDRPTFDEIIESLSQNVPDDHILVERQASFSSTSSERMLEIF